MLEDVELIERTADDRILVVAGHVEEALVGAQELQVVETTDQRRCRVGVERLAEVALGLELGRIVLDDEGKA